MFYLLYLLSIIPFSLFVPTKVLHKERIKSSKRKIITSNHYTNADCLIYDFKFARKFRYMAKIELFKNKLFGLFLKYLGAIPVHRNNFSPKEYKQTLKLIKSNKPVFIFPEGTRNKSGSEDMLDVKSGVITFASRGEADIIPMVMYRPPKLFRKNYILVGEPFKIIAENPKRLTKDELRLNLEKYEQVMQDLRKELDDYVIIKKHKKSKK